MKAVEAFPNQQISLRPAFRSFARWPYLEKTLGFCLFVTAYFFAYKYGMSFSQSSASPFWFPDSILLCALLLTKPKKWWGIFILATLPIRLLVAVTPDIPLWFLLTSFAIDSARGLITAMLLRHFMKNPVRFETVKDFGFFCLFAVLLVPALSALGGAAVRHRQGYEFWTAWQQWFMGDALANLVITPAILYWFFGTKWKFPSMKRILEGGVLAIGLMISGYIAFNGKWNNFAFAEPEFFIPIPFLFWAAIRFGMLGASGAIMGITILSVGAAIRGQGPFSGESPANIGLMLQNFLMIRAAFIYLVAILIEQRTGVENSLRESEERFRNMANTAPVLIWISGPDQLCQFFNQSGLDYTGRTLQQELGTGWSENLHKDDRKHFLEVRDSSFRTHQPYEMECRLRRRDGEYRWFLLKAQPRYAPNGDFMGFIGSGIDIHDRKWAEEANQHLAHVQRLAVMGEFTAMITHEINQPLGAIMSNAEAAELLLQSPNVSLSELREILADIRKDDLRANQTMDRIRALSRNSNLVMEPLNLNETASDVLRLISRDALRRHVKIQREFTGNLPLAFGDRVQLQQVLLNLIVNGIDAMKDTPEPARLLTISTKNSSDKIEVIVTDCGCGIPPEQLPRIFESFFTTKQDGTGLGLSIARSIIEAHKGQMWAENNTGRGATFHFTLQVAERQGSSTTTN